MSYAKTYVRTSVSLDTGTLETLGNLAKRWKASKAEVMRRAIRKLKDEAEEEDKRPTPLEALNWLQKGAGLTAQDGEEFKASIESERAAKHYWWES